MTDVLRDVVGSFILVYLDDIGIYSNTREEPYKHPHGMLHLLREHLLNAKLSQSKGVHILGSQGLQVDP